MVGEISLLQQELLDLNPESASDFEDVFEKIEELLGFEVNLVVDETSEDKYVQEEHLLRDVTGFSGFDFNGP